MGFTVSVTVVVALPVTFVAVIVYVAVAVITVGVPDIIPVVVLNDRPAGKAGLIDQLTTAPPVLVGDSEVIAVLTVYTFVDGL